MRMFVRAVNRGVWGTIDEDSEIPADALTNCLKTSKNTLSVWEIHSQAEFNDAVLAYVTCLRRTDGFSFICMDPDHLEKRGIQIQEIGSATPHKKFADRHRNLESLNYWSLGEVAETIKAEIVQNNEKVFTWKSIKNLIKGAIDSGTIKASDLNEKLREHIGIKA